MKKFILLFAVLAFGSPLFAQQLNRAEGEKKPNAQPVKTSASKNIDARDRAVNTKERPAQVQSGPQVAPMQPAGKEQTVKPQPGQEAKLKKDGSLDKRYKENQKRRKDGKPDMRYKQNKAKEKVSDKKASVK
ncbi:MAG: hypothetical protein RLZZ46_45 [Bacteroidota bacterium]|jgi:hypothetical protein